MVRPWCFGNTLLWSVVKTVKIKMMKGETQGHMISPRASDGLAASPQLTSASKFVREGLRDVKPHHFRAGTPVTYISIQRAFLAFPAWVCTWVSIAVPGQVQERKVFRNSPDLQEASLVARGTLCAHKALFYAV